MRWFKQAEYDWSSAEYNAVGEFHSIACFHAQQAAEKAIKAFLISQGRRAIIGHSILFLVREAVEYNESYHSLLSHGRILDRYYIQTRYPDALPDGAPYESYEAEDSNIALQKSKEIIDHVRSMIIDEETDIGNTDDEE